MLNGKPLRSRDQSVSSSEFNIPLQRAPNEPGEHFGRYLDAPDADANPPIASSDGLKGSG
jgi:hypothetical protein